MYNLLCSSGWNNSIDVPYFSSAYHILFFSFIFFSMWFTTKKHIFVRGLCAVTLKGMSLVFHIADYYYGLLHYYNYRLKLAIEWTRECTGRRGRRRTNCRTTLRGRKYTESWKSKQSHSGELTWENAMDMSWDRLRNLWYSLVNTWQRFRNNPASMVRQWMEVANIQCIN